MNYQVIYETSQFHFEPTLLIPFAMLVFGILLSKYKGYFDKKKQQDDIKIIFGGCFMKFWFAGVLAFCVIITYMYVVDYQNVVVKYKNGVYKSVEGVITNFVPMPYEGHSDETFIVDGVEFSYSDFEISLGYNRSASHGGLITGNGMKVRLRYISYKGENVIVKIEAVY